MTTYKFFGYTNTSATKEQCTIEMRANSKEELRAKCEQQGIVICSEPY